MNISPSQLWNRGGTCGAFALLRSSWLEDSTSNVHAVFPCSGINTFRIDGRGEVVDDRENPSRLFSYETLIRSGSQANASFQSFARIRRFRSLPACLRQREGKTSPFSDFTFYRNGTAVRLYQSLRDSKPEACSFISIRGTRLMKFFKDESQLIVGNTDSGIFYR